MNSLAQIELVESRTSFVNIPPELFRDAQEVLVQDITVRLEFKSHREKKNIIIYVGWSGSVSSKPNSLEIDRNFAELLDIARNLQKVRVSISQSKFDATTVELEPVTLADWEIVDNNSGFMESHILHQTRFVQIDGIILAYPNPNSPQYAKLKVVKITTKENEKAIPYAKLTDNCELYIKPKFKPVVGPPRGSKSIKSFKGAKSEELASVLLRGITLPHDSFKELNELHLYEIYTNFNYVINSLKGAQFVAVSVIPGPGSHLLLSRQTNNQNNQATPPETPNNLGNKENTDKTSGELIGITEAEKLYVRMVHYSGCPRDHVILSRSLSVALNIENTLGQMIVVQEPQESLPKAPPAFVIHPYTTSSSKEPLIFSQSGKRSKKDKLSAELQDYFYKYLELNKSSLTHCMRLPAAPIYWPKGGVLRFKNATGWLKPSSVRVPLEVGEELIKTESFVEIGNIKVQDDSELVGLDDKINQITSIIGRGNTGYLIYGVSGSGKTQVVDMIKKRLNRKLIYTNYIRCEDYANENFLNLKKLFNDAIQQCSWFSPSCLILDNLENIMPCEVEHADSTQSNQITEFFVNSINRVSAMRNVSILMTSKSKESLNQLLFQCHLIKENASLKTPDKEIRKLIIENYLAKLDTKLDFDIMDIISETEGYLANDLKILMDRSYQDSLLNQSNNSLQTIISKVNFEKAFNGYTPSNLRGVKLQKSSVNWSDIGGLKEAKSILLETLEWPTRYAPIFKSCPLRLRSGILLYGYPGCGKTLLASAVAGQCGLNFISIKGPEILNKYIGASEESVRELFERAQSAKPCILFFDEFDSIAPKRGHDSTGVTDRVVNQMLTQMDGAEGLDGVYVLAATSRPDLIDSALLRPGRLDKSVICDMPNIDDRYDILISTTRKMELSEDVDLMEVAKKTEGFSGADIQGLGYNAYLKGVHVKLKNDESLYSSSSTRTKKSHDFFLAGLKQPQQDMSPHERLQILKQIELLFSTSSESTSLKSIGVGNDTQVTVTHQNFIDSLAETKSSISLSEKRKLERIYSQFVSARDGNMPDGSASNEIGGRSTLM